MKDLFFEARIGDVPDEKVNEIVGAFRAFCDRWGIEYDEPSVYDVEEKKKATGKTVVVHTVEELEEASRKAKAGDTIVVMIGDE